MSPLISLFMAHEAQESQALFRWPFSLMTETDPIPNPVAGHSERPEGKSKKGEGLWEPKAEPGPKLDSTVCPAVATG